VFRFVCGALSLASLAFAAAPASALPAAASMGVDLGAPAILERVQGAIAAPHARGPQIAPPAVYPRRARPHYGYGRGNPYGYDRYSYGPPRRIQRAPAYGYYEQPRRRVYREYYYD
jgi:hypothetical protein